MLCFILREEFYFSFFVLHRSSKNLFEKSYNKESPAPLYICTLWTEQCDCRLFRNLEVWITSFWIPVVSQISQIGDRSVTISRWQGARISPAGPIKKCCIKPDLVTLQFSSFLVFHCFTAFKTEDSLEACNWNISYTVTSCLRLMFPMLVKPR